MASRAGRVLGMQRMAGGREVGGLERKHEVVMRLPWLTGWGRRALCQLTVWVNLTVRFKIGVQAVSVMGVGW